MIRLDSIMNFEQNALVDYYGRKAIVMTRFKKTIRVRFLDNGLYDHIHYSDLHVLEYEAFVHSTDEARKHWSIMDLDYLRENIKDPVHKLAEALKRTIGSIEVRKTMIKKELNKKAA